MGMSYEEAAAVAEAIGRQRERRYGTKKAGYSAAVVNSGTWDKAEDPEQVASVRGDLLRRIVRALWPETEGDWLSIPTGDGDQQGVPKVEEPEVLRAIREMREDVAALSERLERIERDLPAKVLTKREQMQQMQQTAAREDPDPNNK